MAETVLKINGLTFAYGGRRELYTDFSLELKKGECIAIVGPSGSGKSTLFELIAGNLSPREGSIRHGRLGWVFQDPYSSFHPGYRIVDQIADVASLEEMGHYLPDLGLDRTLLQKLPHELSGGQLQRCSILRALLMEPELLLCDEPTSALDNLTQLETMKLLIRFLDRLGILLITHDQDLARWAADRIVDLTEKERETIPRGQRSVA